MHRHCPRYIALTIITSLLLTISLSCHKKNDNSPIPPPPVKTQRVITGLNPTHAYIGDSVLLTGTGFTASDSVYFDGVAVTKVMEADAVHFKVIVPEGALSGNIQVGHGGDTAIYDEPFTVDHHIYISGNDYTYGNACYWLDGTQYICGDSKETFATGIYVSGNDVYVAGNKGGLAMYWKNREPHELTTNIQRTTQVNGIFVSGGDVYVVGYAPTDDNAATYWKNGQEVNLTSGVNNSSFGNAIFVSGGDTYVAGLKGNGQAAYWKNKSEVQLSGSNQYPGATCIYVSGDDVYAAGNDNSTAKYWKNGDMVNLTSPDTCFSSANSIFVSGKDVYIAGNEHSTIDGLYRAVYWKNGVTHILNEGSVYALATSICVVDRKVYVSGMVDYYTAAYWVADKLEKIPDLAAANGIFVR